MRYLIFWRDPKTERILNARGIMYLHGIMADNSYDDLDAARRDAKALIEKELPGHPIVVTVVAQDYQSDDTKEVARLIPVDGGIIDLYQPPVYIQEALALYSRATTGHPSRSPELQFWRKHGKQMLGQWLEILTLNKGA